MSTYFGYQLTDKSILNFSDISWDFGVARIGIHIEKSEIEYVLTQLNSIYINTNNDNIINIMPSFEIFYDEQYLEIVCDDIFEFRRFISYFKNKCCIFDKTTHKKSNKNYVRCSAGPIILPSTFFGKNVEAIFINNECIDIAKFTDADRVIFFNFEK